MVNPHPSVLMIILITREEVADVQPEGSARLPKVGML